MRCSLLEVEEADLRSAIFNGGGVYGPMSGLEGSGMDDGLPGLLRFQV